MVGEERAYQDKGGATNHRLTGHLPVSILTYETPAPPDAGDVPLSPVHFAGPSTLGLRLMMENHRVVDKPAGGLYV